MADALAMLNKRWLEKIKLGEKFKRRVFGNDADEAMRFYNGPHDFLYTQEYAADSQTMSLATRDSDDPPFFKMTVNLVSNMVQIFTPVLFHRNPVRTATPRQGGLPDELLLDLIPPEMMQQAAQEHEQQQQQMAQESQGQYQPQPFDPRSLLPPSRTEAIDKAKAAISEWYLNATPRILDLKKEARLAVVESLIKGMGTLWTEIVDTPAGPMVGSTYDSVDNLVLDPDAETIKECKWIARKRRRSVHEVAEDFGIPLDDLKPHAESQDSVAEHAAAEGDDGARKRGAGQTYDVIEYYEVYSLIGIGDKLKGGGSDSSDTAFKMGSALSSTIDSFDLPDQCYLAVVPGQNFPLNIPEEIAKQGNRDDIAERIEWHTPFYNNPEWPWPFSPLYYHEVPNSPWPQAHITPVMGFQKLIDWMYSFLASRAKIANRTLWTVDKSISEDIKDQILYGSDQELLEIENKNGVEFQKLVEFVQQPEMNRDAWTLLSLIQQEFERGVGINELSYGQQGPTQMRSAKEAEIRQQNLSVRPDDMANMVDDWMTQASRNEMAMCREHIDGRAVAHVFGERSEEQEVGDLTVQPLGMYSQMWQDLVFDPGSDLNALNVEFRVESGSARKPNKGREIEKAEQAMQVLFQPALQIYQQLGDPTVANDLLKRYYEAADWEDPVYYDDNRQQMQEQQQAAQQAESQGSQMEAEIKMALQKDEQQHEVAMQDDKQEGEKELTLLEMTNALEIEGIKATHASREHSHSE